MFSSSTFLKLFPLPSRANYIRPKSTIYALSSGMGKCGVAVIRVSGSEAGKAMTELTNLEELPLPRTAVLKNIRHPVSKEIIDKGLVLWFPGPRSYTGEDSCEFHVHGGLAVINEVLDALGSLPKFKLAEPGEFTKRAFFSGKLDLIEVEGLADLLQAETEAQRKQAFLQLDGSLGKLYKKWRQILMFSLACIEAYIDFDETETLEHGLIEGVTHDVKYLLTEIKIHLKDGRRGELLKNGVRTVILGEPNVGKSSLLNIICRRPASIVTPISGTTRDVIEVTLNIGGFPMVISDTAGLRRTSRDIIELEGMLRAIDIYSKADLVLLVIDFENYSSWYRINNSGSFIQYVREYLERLGIEDLTRPDTDNFKEMFMKDCIVVLNKTDLDTQGLSSKVDGEVLKVSCKTEDGIRDFVHVLSHQLKALCGEPSRENPIMSQTRHKQELQTCQYHLELYLEEVSRKEGSEMVLMSEHLRRALGHLGQLVGCVTSQELLDALFQEFCIGK